MTWAAKVCAANLGILADAGGPHTLPAGVVQMRRSNMVVRDSGQVWF